MGRNIVRGTCTECGNAAHECECYDPKEEDLPHGIVVSELGVVFPSAGKPLFLTLYELEKVYDAMLRARGDQCGFCKRPRTVSDRQCCPQCGAC